MQISELKPTNILDADKEDEVIHFESDGKQNGFYFTKYRYLNTNFAGQPILENDKFIRTKSLWYADLINGQTEELIPFGSFDIQGIHIAENYVYFIKILDKDRDGLLEEEDYYTGAEIWRVNKKQKTIEFCFDFKGKYHHYGFETANDDVVVFRDEDEITELVFVDLSNHRYASLLDDGEGENNFDFRFVEDEKNNPTYFLTKKFIFEAEPSSPKHTLNCIKWSDLLTQLDWKSY